jgi:hypothetical protein
MNLSAMQTPSGEMRNRIGKVAMLGFALPLGILLVLQATPYSIFPGKSRLIRGVLEVVVFGLLLLNAAWEFIDRRQGKQLN